MTLVLEGKEIQEHRIKLKENDMGFFVMIDGKYSAAFYQDGSRHLYDENQVSEHADRWDK